MAVKRTTTRFKVRNDVFSSITPNPIRQREISAPQGNWRPADWLPIQFTKSDRDQGEDAYTISSGKLVSLDGQGKVVPTGLRIALGSAGAGVLTYTQSDEDWGVFDLTTGERCVAGAAYTNQQIAQALLDRGLVTEQEFVDVSGLALPINSDAKALAVIEIFISRPVGVIAYDVHVWSGLPEEGDEWFTNYSKQHAVQFLTEAQMQLPQLVAAAQASDDFDIFTIDGGGTTVYAAPDQVLPDEYWNATNLASITRYSLLGVTASSPVVALGLDPTDDGATQCRLARHTDRTPIACDRTGVLVKEKSSPDKIAAEGDFYVDYDLGVLFLHTDTWATLVALGSATTNFSYSYYLDGLSDGHQMVHFDGWGRSGEEVTWDAQSNFRPFTAAEKQAGIDPLMVVGRLDYLEVQPRSLLSSVKTAFNLSNMAASGQMPGSATKGFTDLITLSPEVVADQVAVITVRI